MLKTISNLFKYRKYSKIFKKEYNDYLQGKSNSQKGYIAFRKLFVFTHGKSNDSLSNEINNSIGKYETIDKKGILENYTSEQIKNAIDEMIQNGYHIFDIELDTETLNEIYQYAATTPVSYMNTNNDNQEYSSEKILFDSTNPISPRYEFTQNEILKCNALQKLIFDSSFLNFAQEYLGCKPILDLVAFWWSAPFGGKAKNAAAQMYHFDLDRIKFMKFFFYITDVNTNTGPHCYVKGSHGKLPKQINRDGRFEDFEIEKIYGKENLIEINGKKGSIIAVDTRGFHKGKELIEGKRLLFQIQYTNSLFGQTYPAINESLILPEYKKITQEYTRTYTNIS